jgi:hypothetical protein
MPDAWEKWNERYGAWFRTLHGIGDYSDAERVGSEPAPARELPLPPGAAG